MNGIICVNKPQDFTSFDVVAKLRGILKMKRLGHGGTLDPMATGVLPVFVGNATKACDIMPDNTKSYRAGFRLGAVSDTQDVWGEVREVSDIAVSRSDIEAVMPEFMGKIMQLPPMYSAVQVNGQRLYDLARQGIEVERQAREIEVESLELEEYDSSTREGVMLYKNYYQRYRRKAGLRRYHDISRENFLGGLYSCRLLYLRGDTAGKGRGQARGAHTPYRARFREAAEAETGRGSDKNVQKRCKARSVKAARCARQ